MCLLELRVPIDSQRPEFPFRGANLRAGTLGHFDWELLSWGARQMESSKGNAGLLIVGQWRFATLSKKAEELKTGKMTPLAKETQCYDR